MIGYIYDTITRKIATKVENVQKCNNTTIQGEFCKARLGTGQYVITDQIFDEGDILPEGTDDRRSEISILIE
jgi:hypothetical protein